MKESSHIFSLHPNLSLSLSFYIYIYIFFIFTFLSFGIYMGKGFFNPLSLPSGVFQCKSFHPPTWDSFRVYNDARTRFQDISSNFWWTKAMTWEMRCLTQMPLNCQQRSKRVLLVFCSLCLFAEVCLGLRSAHTHNLPC